MATFTSEINPKVVVQNLPKNYTEGLQALHFSEEFFSHEDYTNVKCGYSFRITSDYVRVTEYRYGVEVKETSVFPGGEHQISDSKVTVSWSK
ncbi:hypothetical protein [Shimazuella alba]|uniref:Uncharacterized protein n=1 Tax=Shimazuella alba TaxID=2690964 RepID=A0A6I4VS65_9BACL|nr:hypothetical protein [Shimazuella alba]MXQ54427.1 hypothetical protein [Shimazuella alba]